MMLCPKCETSFMHERERGDIVLDVCRDCGGVWLDQGELERLLQEAMAAGARRAAQQQASAYERDHLGHPGHHDYLGHPGHPGHGESHHAPYHPSPPPYYGKKHKGKRGKYDYEHKKRKKQGLFALIEDIFD